MPWTKVVTCGCAGESWGVLAGRAAQGRPVPSWVPLLENKKERKEGQKEGERERGREGEEEEERGGETEGRKDRREGGRVGGRKGEGRQGELVSYCS